MPVRTGTREAILEAAFTVCAQKGYAQACVQDIAAAAGVAKPTVYNHLSDKATLFLHALEHVARQQLEAQLAALAPLEGPAADQSELAHALTTAGETLLALYDGEPARALRRLLHAELPTMPDLAAVVAESGQHRLQRALADRLARFMLAGRLSPGPGQQTDPDRAAETWLALLLGPVDTRTRFGGRNLDDGERHELAANATALLLRSAEVPA